MLLPLVNNKENDIWYVALQYTLIMNVRSLTEAHFKSIRHLNYDIFLNEFPAYFGNFYKLSSVLIQKWIFDLSWTKKLKKAKCRCKTKIYLHNKQNCLWPYVCSNIEQRSVLLQEELGVSMYVINYNGRGGILRLKSSDILTKV